MHYTMNTEFHTSIVSGYADVYIQNFDGRDLWYT